MTNPKRVLANVVYWTGCVAVTASFLAMVASVVVALLLAFIHDRDEAIVVGTIVVWVALGPLALRLWNWANDARRKP